MTGRRTQAERSAATRQALLTAARPLFAERGFAAVGTDEIARAAGVTRGALYHQFDGKAELFAAVFEQVHEELAARISDRLVDAADDPLGVLHDGIDAWLAACSDHEVAQILLVEAPAALGWSRWREVGRRHGVGLVESAIRAVADAGLLGDLPVRPLAHVLVGALEEAALYAARSTDPDARAEAERAVRSALEALVGGLLAAYAPRPAPDAAEPEG